jgi:ketosteroid isomerase-like protein
VSANLDLVRAIYADWERGDFFSRADWADPEIEFVIADGPETGRATGLAAMADAWRSRLSGWQDVQIYADTYRELEDGRVVVLVKHHGRGKLSGVEMVGPQTETAHVFGLRGGRVTRLFVYWDRDRALADLGLEE